jgi:hypothetical protein
MNAAKRYWRSYSAEPLPSGAEALGQPFSAFPSWFLRIECDRGGGKEQMFSPSLAGAHKCYAERAHYCEAVKGTYKG